MYWEWNRTLVPLRRKNSNGTIELPLIWGRWTGYLLQQRQSCEGCGQRLWDNRVRSTLTNSCGTVLVKWVGNAVLWDGKVEWCCTETKEELKVAGELVGTSIIYWDGSVGFPMGGGVWRTSWKNLRSESFHWTHVRILPCLVKISIPKWPLSDKGYKGGETTMRFV